MNRINLSLRTISNHALKIKDSSYIIQTNRYLNLSSVKTVTKNESKDETETEIPLSDILEDLKEPEMTEEEILQKCFKARLPERVYKMQVLKQNLPLTMKNDFELTRLRRHFAMFGKSTKLNPGLCWPTREEILETIEYDKTFEPSLQDRIHKVQEKKMKELKEKQDYEAEVERNMANNDKWIAEYYEKIRKNEEKVKQLRLARERLVEEISEYLGYSIDPKDPRFKEAVEQREKEKKKELKVKKQQESYDKMIEKLKKIAQQNKP